MGNIYCDSYALSVKDRFNGIRKFTTLAVILFSVMSLGYFIFWLGAISDEIFFGYGKGIFEPLAKFLNMGDTSLDIYMNTSLMLVGAIIPTLFVQYLCDKIEEALINENRLKQEKKRQKEMAEEQKSYLGRFDSIKTYSICLSIDYEGEKEISRQSKTTMNKVVYSKMAALLSSLEPNSKITYNDVFIFTGHNFSNYDNVYDSILNGLSQIKNVIEKKYNYRFIPSITTDAYSGDLVETSIRKQHFEIQSFNFKNRSLTTASFADKYKHLRYKKYAGIPIGEYAYFRNDKMGTYELNVIHKNLSKILT